MGKLTHWAATFAVVGMVSAFLGYGGAAGAAAPAAKLLFWFSLAVIMLSIAARITNWAWGRA